ncbi:MAG: hypothetical protein REH83_01410, partial [Rickettsiella sp.]|nr:hypothetical protein [Rickettsiella sp.]
AREIVDFTPARWAKYTSCSASIVEGEIYRKNIIEGFTRCKFSKKTLWEFLIVQKFEADIELLEQSEKEIKEKLYYFFCDIKLKKDNYKLDEHEINYLEKYIVLLGKSESLSKEILSEISHYFYNLKNKRDGISEFVEFNLVQSGNFLALEKSIEELNKRRDGINCTFLTSYQANKLFLKEAKSTNVDKNKIREAEKKIKYLREILVDCVAYPEKQHLLYNFYKHPNIVETEKEGEYVLIDYNFPPEKTVESDINSLLILRLQKELSSTKLKLWSLRFSMLFSIIAGIAVGVVTFYTFPAVLVGLGLSLSLTALSTVLWPLAILAAISYAMLIYNTLADLIINETLSKWWKNFNKEIEQTYYKLHLFKYSFIVVYKTLSQFFLKLINWFKPKKEEGWFKYSLRIILSLLVIGFGVVAALATGYTAFVQLQPYVNVTVCVITALPLLISDLIFSLKNSFESAGLLTAISFANLRDPIIKAWRKLKEQIQTENYLQLVLHIFRIPFKFALTIFKLAIFLCHVVFTSVASDRLFNLPCWLAFFFSFGSELLTDMCPLFGKEKGQHDHDHGGVFDWIGKLIFIIPATILGVLNSFFSQLNWLFSNSDLQPLGPWQAIQQEWDQFDIQHLRKKKENNDLIIDIDPAQARQLPKEVALQKAIKICDKQINRLQHGFFIASNLAISKKDFFVNYKAKLVKSYQEKTDIPHVTDSQRKVLNSHRFFKFSRATESIKKLDKINSLLDCYNEAGNTTISNGHALCIT